MSKVGRKIAAVGTAVLLTMGTTMTVLAAEPVPAAESTAEPAEVPIEELPIVPAEISPQDLIAAVNQSVANVHSMAMGITENVVMNIDGTTSTVHFQANGRIADLVSYMNMNFQMEMPELGVFLQSGIESYTGNVNGMDISYMRPIGAAKWEYSESPGKEAAGTAASFMEITDIEGAVVMQQGTRYHLQGTIAGGATAEIFAMSGMKVDSEIPVVIVIDGTSMLPLGIFVQINGIQTEMNGQVANANVDASIAFGDFGAYDGMVIPDAVVQNVAK